MKFNYRITKYDPAYRNKEGHYTRDEWTCISDIGKKFGRKVLTKKAYKEFEDKYVQAILRIMRDSNISQLQIFDLERPEDSGVSEKQVCDIEEIDKVVRGSLRNDFWCRLQANRKMFVHFGWNYYMYVGVSRYCEKAIAEIRKSGLFVETFKSPYHRKK